MVEQKQISILVYGMGNSLLESWDYLKLRFNIIGCSDSNNSKKNVGATLGLRFYEKKELISAEYDYIVITSIYDDEIKNDLMQMGIQEGKIWTRKQWCHLPLLCHFGDLHPDKTFYVLARPIRIKNGLMSFLFSFLEQLLYIDAQGFVPIVDMKYYRNQYIEDGQVGKVNAWDNYFIPLCDIPLEEVYMSKNVVMGYDDPNYMGRYDTEYNLFEMNRVYQKYIKLQANIACIVGEKVKDILEDNEGKVLGVLFRGTDFATLKLKDHPMQPTRSDMKENIDRCMKEWGYDKIYLCTEDMDALDYFKNEYGDKLLYTDQYRFRNTGNNWLADIEFDRENDRYLRGMEYLVSILLLSKCDSLLGSICSGSVMAHIIGIKDYKHIELINMGIYL